MLQAALGAALCPTGSHSERGTLEEPLREAEPVLSIWSELGVAGQQGAAKGRINSDNREFWGCSRCHGSSVTKASLFSWETKE